MIIMVIMITSEGESMLRIKFALAVVGLYFVFSTHQTIAGLLPSAEVTTIMMEYSPGQYLKVLVLEGSLRLSRNGSFGDSVVLHPGKMVIMRPDAKKIPDPIDVDLAEIVKTSTLVNFPGSDILPSMSLIQAAINDQARELTKGNLVPTNLVMGHGTNV